MKLAYFAPLPPKRSGVADYAAHLARALAAHADIDFFDTGSFAAPIEGATAIDYGRSPEALLRLPEYDAVLYQLGNNPSFHAAIYRAFLAFPGPVVLHDTILYFLMAGLGPGGLAREFLANYGPDRLAELIRIPEQSPQRIPLRFPFPERYPMLGRVLQHAPRIVVHSRTSADGLRALGYRRPIDVIPLLVYPASLQATDPVRRAQTRRALGVADHEILLGCYGFIGATKRFPTILSALARLKNEMPVRLLILGEGPTLEPDILANGVQEQVILRGYVDEAAFDDSMRAADIVLNLRYPSMGETSATQIQAMAAGLASIVSEHAWFGELPDGTVRKIPVGPTEEAGLVEALRELVRDPARRQDIGAAARRHVADHHAGEKSAAAYAAILRAQMNDRPRGLYRGPPQPPPPG